VTAKTGTSGLSRFQKQRSLALFPSGLCDGGVFVEREREPLAARIFHG